VYPRSCRGPRSPWREGSSGAQGGVRDTRTEGGGGII